MVLALTRSGLTVEGSGPGLLREKVNDAPNAIEDALDPSRSLTTLAERVSGPLIKPGNKFEPGKVGTEAATPGERATTALKAAGDRVAASVTKVGDQVKKVTDQVKKALTPKTKPAADEAGLDPFWWTQGQAACAV